MRAMFGWFRDASDLRLPLESREAIGIVGERLGQDLDRDVALQLRIARAIDLAHAARAERARRFRKDPREDQRRGRGDDGVSSIDVWRRPIEDACVRGVPRQQRLDFTTQGFVVTRRGGQKGVALAGRPIRSGLKQRLYSRPSLVRHDSPSGPGWRLSQLRQ